MVAPAYLTVPQCAERLGISTAVVYAALLAGTLPGVRFGRPGKRGTWRVEAYQLDVWVQSLTVSVPPPPPAPAARPPARFRHISLD